jgi:choline-sulfatase
MCRAANVLLFALGAALAACAARAPRLPNVLLITLDTTRADHIGAYGYRRAQTPNLDRLAASGVLFERAIAAAPITLPAHVSLLTGVYPFTHGVRNNGSFALGQDRPTLATVLHAAGYRTAAFVSAFVLDRRYGLARGFDDYDDRVELERRGEVTTAAAEAWLAANAPAGRPFFLWVHLYDPHDPYDPPPPFRESFATQPYDGEIAYDDQNVGRLLTRLGQLELEPSTVVAIVGDHGESLGEHGEATHAMFVYDAAVRVPLVLSAPGRLAAGRRVRAPVRAVDVAPTLLALAGQPAMTGSEGVSLLPLVDGRAAGSPAAYSETYFPRLFMNWSELRSIQDDRWKYIEAPRRELYDLANDPAETTNLAEKEPSRADALARALADLTARARPLAVAPIDRDTQQKLAALGYIGTGPTVVTAANGARPDPKAMIGTFNRLRDANALLQRGRFEEAGQMAASILEHDRSNAFATMIRARAEMEEGRYREAVTGFRAYANLVPSSADAHHWTAICLSRLGDVDAALAEADVALSIDPRYAEAHALRGGLLAARGRLDEGATDLRAAISSARENLAFRIGLARILVSARKLDEAQRELEAVLAASPNQPDARAAYGGLLAARGQLEPARAEYERALALRPAADDVRLDYADVLARLGRREEALREYARLADGRETPDEIRRAARVHLRGRR